MCEWIFFKNYALILHVNFSVLFQAAEQTDETAQEIYRLQMLIQEEDQKFERCICLTVYDSSICIFIILLVFVW